MIGFKLADWILLADTCDFNGKDIQTVTDAHISAAVTHTLLMPRGSPRALTWFPASLQSNKSVKVFDFSNNQLQKLPESLGRLKNLTSLNVGMNKLQGLPEGKPFAGDMLVNKQLSVAVAAWELMLLLRPQRSET